MNNGKKDALLIACTLLNLILLFAAGCGKKAEVTESTTATISDAVTKEATTEYIDEANPDTPIYEGHEMTGSKSIYDISYVVEGLSEEHPNGELLTFSMNGDSSILFVWQENKKSFVAEQLDIKTGSVSEIVRWDRLETEENDVSFSILSIDPLVLRDDYTSVIYIPQEGKAIECEKYVPQGYSMYKDGEIYLFDNNALYRMEEAEVNVLGEDRTHAEPLYQFSDGYDLGMENVSYPENCISFGRSFGDSKVYYSFDPETEELKSYLIDGFDLTEFYYCGDIGYQYYIQENEKDAEIDIVYRDEKIKKSVDFNMGGAYYITMNNYPASKDYAVINLYEVMGDGEKYVLIDMNAYDGEKYEIPEFSEIDFSDEALEAKVNEMFKKYEVNVFYGDTVPEVQDYDYTPIEDPITIYISLIQLDNIMSKYPEGFFRELTNGDYYCYLYVCLTGGLTGEDTTTSLESAGGLTSEMVDGVALYFDISDGLQKSSFIHEMVHTTDNMLLAEGYIDDSEWDSFNPDGFSYYYAYVSEDGNGYDGYDAGNMDYTGLSDDYIEGNFDNIYFYTIYSKTYETEDRATIYENLLMDYLSESTEDMVFKSPHIQEKIEYYNEALRKCYGTDDWGDDVMWENALDEVKEY